jgi:hypothetical protein
MTIRTARRTVVTRAAVEGTGVLVRVDMQDDTRDHVRHRVSGSRNLEPQEQREDAQPRHQRDERARKSSATALEEHDRSVCVGVDIRNRGTSISPG